METLVKIWFGVFLGVILYHPANTTAVVLSHYFSGVEVYEQKVFAPHMSEENASRPDVMSVVKSSTKGIYCADYGMKAGVDVYVVPNLGDTGTKGRFYTDSSMSMITLVDPSIEVIAHEVSHFMDYLMQYKGINDGETRAYLQGYFTDCIYRGLDRNTIQIKSN